jgi:hypothetical protein
MALTLTEAAKFSRNMVRKGVLEIIIKDSVVLANLPFKDIVGNAYQYLQENTLGSASFYNPGDIWVEQTPTFTQKTAGLKIMGGDADVDNFLQATRSDITDIQSEIIEKKAKGVKHTFLDTFYYGDSAVNTKQFDGLHKLVTAAQTIHQGSGSTGAALSVSNLDALLDLVFDGPADYWLMSKKMRTALSVYIRKSRGPARAWAARPTPARRWSGATSPIAVDDFIVNTETIGTSAAYTAKTGGATTSIFLVRFGTDDLCGLQHGGLVTNEIGQLESKDAKRWRIKWYVSLALMRDFALSMIDGINPATAVVD